MLEAMTAEIAELRDRLQQRQRQQRDELERLLLQQQHNQQQQQQDNQQLENQQQQQHNQQLENQQDKNQQRPTSTTSSISPVVSAAVAAPTWTLNAAGVPVLIGAAPSAAAPSAAPSAEAEAEAEGDSAAAPLAEAEAEAEGDSADEAYEATRHMPNKWRVRHDMLETAVLQQEHKRARRLAKRMYAGPTLGYT